MTPRNRAILVVGLAVLLIIILIAIVLLFLRSTKAPATTPTAPTTSTTTQPTPTQAVLPNPLNPTPVAAPAGRTAAQQMAELFAERYGSYSNQGDYRNLTDLLPVMSDRFRTQTEASLSSASSTPGAAYTGVTSRKISTEVRAYDEGAGTATIAVMLQQDKANGSGASAVSYRSLRLTLVKVGAEWRVDAAVWEN